MKYEINIVKDFSEYPGLRYKSISDDSAEEFRDDIISPVFEKLKKDDYLKINLDGTGGICSSFLEECFGGLARKYGSNNVSNKIDIISNKDNYEEEAFNYIKSATRIFLGGTCNNTTWRDKLIPELLKNNIGSFSPVVENWTEECIEKENIEKYERCDLSLFYITSDMIGVYSIMEIALLLSEYHIPVVFIVNKTGFNEAQIKSFEACFKALAKVLTKNICMFVDSDEQMIEKITRNDGALIKLLK